MLYEGILPKFCGIGGVIPGSNRTKCKVLYTAARSIVYCSRESALESACTSLQADSKVMHGYIHDSRAMISAWTDKKNKYIDKYDVKTEKYTSFP